MSNPELFSSHDSGVLDMNPSQVQSSPNLLDDDATDRDLLFPSITVHNAKEKQFNTPSSPSQNKVILSSPPEIMRHATHICNLRTGESTSSSSCSKFQSSILGGNQPSALAGGKDMLNILSQAFASCKRVCQPLLDVIAHASQCD
jgi:hypothetical protein